MEVLIANERIDAAVKIGVEMGGFDGSHHKDWVIDQMIRELVGDRYPQLVWDVTDGHPENWECGIAP
ncbi:MAG: hypothetical protein KAS32_02400 [Candidatus Peribacteraceae bacterium]|nr:hypothetical protein [Candidatus Peribacteraceae bacterium]